MYLRKSHDHCSGFAQKARKYVLRMKILQVLMVWCSMFCLSGAIASDFTADRVVVKNGHLDRATIYCRANMWRIEHNTSSPVDITIVRKDKGVMWLLMARTKRFITLPLDEEIGATCQHDLGFEQRRDLIGTETLEGRSSTVFKVTVRKGREDVVYYEWQADDVHLPLRFARKDGTWLVDYTHLRVTRLSAELFELPSHYSPLELRALATRTK